MDIFSSRASRAALRNSSIEPLFEDQDKRFGINANTKTNEDDPSIFVEENPYAPDEYDPTDARAAANEN